MEYVERTSAERTLTETCFMNEYGAFIGIRVTNGGLFNDQVDDAMATYKPQSESSDPNSSLA